MTGGQLQDIKGKPYWTRCKEMNYLQQTKEEQQKPII